MAEPGLPHRFVPTSTSWTNARCGWVLGFAQENATTQTALLHTVNGGLTWRRRAAPEVTVTPFSGHVRVHAANEEDVLVTNGETVLATHDAAESWHRVELADTRPQILVGAVDSGPSTAYAVITSGPDEDRRTRLFSSPVSETRWEPVPGLEIPGPSGGSVVVSEEAAFVTLGGGEAAGRYWITEDGRHWQEKAPPCSEVHMAPRLALPPGDSAAVFAVCGYQADQPPGHTYKDLKCSVNGAPFETLGRAPAPGTTRGLAVPTPFSALLSSVGGGFGFLFRSTDAGDSWETALRREPPSLLDLDFQDPVRGVVVHGSGTGEHGVVLRTVDGGASWQELPLE
ncbi:hypothetical protein [Actinopolyspora saharensis]|uniref:sialidase family protein n=1 Tax=Actinopolyspora saharensis TaxID=995062 RepID=UPI003F67A1A0